MKKLLPIIIVLVLLLAGLVGFLVLKPKKPNSGPQKIVEAVNTVPVSDRPYVTLTPTSTGKHPVGKEVEITVHNTTLDSTQAEYELEYQAGSLLQGAFGSIDFSVDPPPVSKVILLGTCSAGGKCDYNQDVTGGTLLVRLSGGQQKFAVKGEWSYGLMSERAGKFSSRDSKFRVDLGEKGLPAGAFAIVMQTMGLPSVLPDGEELVMGPYHVAVSNEETVKSAEVSFRLSEEDGDTFKLLGWTGSTWKEYKSETADKTITATVDRLTTFVVVKSS